MQNTKSPNELIHFLNDFFNLLLKEAADNKNGNTYKSKVSLKTKTLKEKAKGLLENLTTSNTVGTRIFIPDENDSYKNKKIAFCFLIPGVVSSSVKYQIKKNIEKNDHILILKGNYNNPFKTYFNSIKEGTIFTNTKLALPETEFVVKIRLNKKDWDFNGIEKKVKNGAICLLIPERNEIIRKQKDKKQRRRN